MCCKNLLMLFLVQVVLTGCYPNAQPANNTMKTVVRLNDVSDALILDAIEGIASANGLQKVSVVPIERGPTIYQDPEHSVQEITISKIDNSLVVVCKSIPPSMTQSGAVIKPFLAISKLDEHFNVKIER